jgi:hypothetical protein
MIILFAAACSPTADLEGPVFKEFDVCDVPYDGNCLFACLARGLNKESALDIRHEVINYLRENPNMVSIFVLDNTNS